mmetsp:Transcript_15146/g.32879  ORF Transcript_15146/g.32879 Transcript_15146/m.32879 type:complete len:291 (-) Transcript_15146:96-968(-)
MGICISTAGVCISTTEDALNDFLDRQSRFYKESKQAKEHLAKKNAATNGNDSHINAILQSDLSPIYPSLPNAAQKYLCRNVYDGDTLTLDDGSRVRLLGIDTPELKEKQPFALEAKEYTKKYCHGKNIWLTFQENGGIENDKNKDHYGRLLAFIWVSLSGDDNNGGKKGEKTPRQSSFDSNASQWLCINEGLVASGLAHSYSPSKSKKVHNHDKLLGLQKLARGHKRGQWKTHKDYNAIVTPSGSAFHKCKNKRNTLSDCKYLARSKSLSLLSVSDAYDKGLHPCRNCFG